VTPGGCGMEKDGIASVSLYPEAVEEI